ncbi:MAG TPA: RHS repeat-associated core domain-containing protein [Candidatus Acidoferrales bacterium]|nr:RHS repeat-associated core domain-containing protein [Candidatus Acidoferrales bacterium]
MAQRVFRPVVFAVRGSGAFNFTVSYAYDTIGELTGVTSNWPGAGVLLSSATYNAARQLTGDSLGDGPETFAYNSRMWLGSIQAGSLPNYTYTLSLGYAGDGSVTSSNDSVNGNMSFTYDNLNRLASMSSPSNPSGCYGLSWSYDGAGNRTAQSVTSGSCPASSLGFSTSNQITSPSGYQYDAAGNLTNDTAHSYTYDAEGRILTIDGGSGVYVYDAFGRRIEKTTGSTSLVLLYDLAGRRIGAVSTSGADVDHRIYAGSRLVAAYTPGPFGGTTYFYHSDQLGTDRVITNLLGQETCTSLPFGDNHSCTSNVPARFAGYDADDEFGLDHAPARYYSPSLGRFLRPDPLGGGLTNPQSLNRYAYVTNDPATLPDPSGMLPQQPVPQDEWDPFNYQFYEGSCGGDCEPEEGAGFSLPSSGGDGSGAGGGGSGGPASLCNPSNPYNARVLNFIRANLAAAEKLAAELSVPVENVLGLAGEECTYGTSTIARDANNFFGLHAGAPGSVGTYTTGKGAVVARFPAPGFANSGQSLVDAFGNLVAGVTDPGAFAKALVPKFNSGNLATGGNPHFVALVTGAIQAISSRLKNCFKQ